MFKQSWILFLLLFCHACKPTDNEAPKTIKERLVGTWSEVGNCSYCDTISFFENGTFSSKRAIFNQYTIVTFDTVQFHHPSNSGKRSLAISWSDQDLYIHCWTISAIGNCYSSKFKRQWSCSINHSQVGRFLVAGASEPLVPSSLTTKRKPSFADDLSLASKRLIPLRRTRHCEL